MMSVLAELEHLGGERSASSVKKRPPLKKIATFASVDVESHSFICVLAMENPVEFDVASVSVEHVKSGAGPP